MTWSRRLRSGRWIRAWLKSNRSTRPIVSLLIVGIMADILVATLKFEHKKNVDQLQLFLFVFAGLALVFTMVLLLPGRDAHRQKREERRHKRRVERSLVRLVDLLERRSANAAEQPRASPPRTSPWLLIIAALVIGWRGGVKPRARR